MAEKLNDDIIPSLTHVLTESKFFSSLKVHTIHFIFTKRKLFSLYNSSLLLNT